MRAITIFKNSFNHLRILIIDKVGFPVFIFKKNIIYDYKFCLNIFQGMSVSDINTFMFKKVFNL